MVSLTGAESADIIIAVTMTFGTIIVILLLTIVIVSALVAHIYCRKDKGKY